jgi:hypothetical protein
MKLNEFDICEHWWFKILNDTHNINKELKERI